MQSWKCHELVCDCLVSVNESKPEKHFMIKKNILKVFPFLSLKQKNFFFIYFPSFFMLFADSFRMKKSHTRLTRFTQQPYLKYNKK